MLKTAIINLNNTLKSGFWTDSRSTYAYESLLHRLEKLKTYDYFPHYKKEKGLSIYGSLPTFTILWYKARKTKSRVFFEFVF